MTIEYILTRLGPITLMSLGVDAARGSLSKATEARIALDLSQGGTSLTSTPITPAEIQAIIALIVQMLPAILALISMFAG